MMNLVIRIASVIEPEYNQRKPQNKLGGVLLLLYLSVRYLGRIVKSLCGKYVVVPRMEIALTSRCSLRCKNCVSLMQYYKHPTDVSLETNLKSLRNIIDASDQLNQLKILGGEPFLYKDLDKVINEALQGDKVKKIMIITNGTIMPKGDSLLEALSNERVEIRISYYGEHSRNAKAIKAMCAENGIKCYAKYEMDEVWSTPGGPQKRNRSIKELKHQYSHCTASLCNNLLGGKLYHCSRSSNGANLGAIPDVPEDYVDVMRDISRDQLQQELMRFLYHDRGYVLACDYCDISTSASKECIPGEQQ